MRHDSFGAAIRYDIKNFYKTNAETISRGREQTIKRVNKSVTLHGFRRFTLFLSAFFSLLNNRGYSQCVNNDSRCNMRLYKQAR